MFFCVFRIKVKRAVNPHEDLGLFDMLYNIRIIYSHLNPDIFHYIHAYILLSLIF